MTEVPEEHECVAPVGEHTGGSSPHFREEREQLARVLRHPEIQRSASIVRFLNFICDKYFEDKTAEIREHTIAVHALGRRESTFDSQVDPIVRVTARALRKRLRDYYDHEGMQDPLEITIPLGRYIPQFARRLPADTPGSNLRQLVDSESSAPLGAGSISRISGAIASTTGKRVEASTGDDAVSSTVVALSLVRRGPVWIRWMGLIAGGLGLLALIFLLGLVTGKRLGRPEVSNIVQLRWGTPVWNDEFDGAANQAPDATKWTFDVGSQNSWGNHEIEIYCSALPGEVKGCDPQHPNAFLDGLGHLVLRAQRNADGNWTSARITTRGLKEFQYGRIEARMKLPIGTGLWPAFWMLGVNFPKEGWPAAGSVDIVENVGVTASTNGLGSKTIRSSIHIPGYSGGNSPHRNFQLPNGGRVDDADFHTYGIIWSPGMVQFYVDDPTNIFFVENMSELPQGGAWVLDHPFYLVLNLAVGGDWAGDPDNSTPSPADVVVDYVRSYRIPTTAPDIEIHPVDVRAGGIASSSITLRGQRGIGRVFLTCATVPATSTCALNASTVDFTATDSQQDTVTVSAIQNGKVVTPTGKYSMTITATTISGDRSEVTEPFLVKPAI